MPSVESMSTAHISVGTEEPGRIGFVRQLGIDSGYILLGCPLAVASFAVLVAGFAAGLGTLVIVVGVPILAGTFAALTGLAVLNTLGTAIGLSAWDPGDDTRRFAIGAGVWGVISLLISFGLGGFIAGRSEALR